MACALRAAVERLDEAAACSMANAAKEQEEGSKVATATRSREAEVSGSATVDCDRIPGPGSGILRFGSEPGAAGAAGIANHCSTGQCNIGSLGLPLINVSILFC